MPTRRPLRLIVATAVLSGPAVVVAALTAPAAHAAAPGPWQVYSSVVSENDFTRMGHVPGHQGNAHTGSVNFDTSDDAVAVYLNDWQCPAGVRPPRSGIDYPPGDCTLLLAEDSQQPSTTTPAEEYPTFSGPLTGSYRSRLEFVSETDGSSRYVDVSFHWARVGPVTRTVTDQSTSTTQAYEVLLTAPMRLTGSVDWARLSRPGTRTYTTRFLRDTFYDRTRG